MKRFSVLFFVAMIGSSVFAHDLWVNGKNGDVFEADMIYGHHFPTPEAIASDRVQIFEPIVVIGENFNQTLTQSGENYHYKAKDKLKDGTYVLKAYYKPTSWIKKADGKWEMNKTRKDTKDEVVYCGISSMQAKAILTIGENSSAFATKPLGQGVEITPLVDTSKFTKDTSIQFKLTKDGKPVKNNEIFGNFKEYSADDMSMAFYAKTNLDGIFEFKALKSGLWYLKTDVKTQTGNADCELIADKSTLTFMIK